MEKLWSFLFGINLNTIVYYNCVQKWQKRYCRVLVHVQVLCCLHLLHSYCDNYGSVIVVGKSDDWTFIIPYLAIQKSASCCGPLQIHKKNFKTFENRPGTDQTLWLLFPHISSVIGKRSHCFQRIGNYIQSISHVQLSHYRLRSFGLNFLEKQRKNILHISHCKKYTDNVYNIPDILGQNFQLFTG